MRWKTYLFAQNRGINSALKNTIKERKHKGARGPKQLHGLKSVRTEI